MPIDRIFNDIQRAGNLGPLWLNLQKHLLMFSANGDHNPRHNLPGMPMLQPFEASAALIGLAIMFRTMADHRLLLLMAWFSVTLAGGVLSSEGEGPQAYRTIALVPVIAVLAGVGVIQSARALRGYSPRFYAVGFVLALCAAISDFSITLGDFFDRYPKNESVWIGFNATENEVAHELLSRRQAGESLASTYLSQDLYWFATIRFFLLKYDGNSDGQHYPEYKKFETADPRTVEQLDPLSVTTSVIIPWDPNDTVFHRFQKKATNVRRIRHEARGIPVFDELIVPPQKLLEAASPENTPEVDSLD